MVFAQRPLRPQEKTLWRKQKILWIILLSIIVLGIGGWRFSLAHYENLLKTAETGPAETKIFEIPIGSTVKNIAIKLEDEKLIPSAWAFQKYIAAEKRSNDFQAGRFYIPQNLTIPDVALRLLDGSRRENFFTIPEGLTLEEIDARIAEKGYAPAGAFLDCVLKTCDFSDFPFLPKIRTEWEGYFFPETYAVLPQNFSVADLAHKMVTEFERRAKKIGILDQPNFSQIVIMASLVEKESRTDSERPIIAGILWKRLRENWHLDVDATVRYFTKKRTEALTKEDLESENPYNTRKRTGLPPGAICNPGESALSAALHPQSSPYYYYLHGKDGQAYFAVTNVEHNRNKEKYL